ALALGAAVDVEGVELDHVPPGGAGSFQHLRDVLEGDPRLDLDVVLTDDVALGVHGDLAAHEHEVSDLPALRERDRDGPIPVVPRHDPGAFHAAKISCGDGPAHRSGPGRDG